VSDKIKRIHKEIKNFSNKIIDVYYIIIKTIVNIMRKFRYSDKR